jgi:hypothetical protein
MGVCFMKNVKLLSGFCFAVATLAMGAVNAASNVGGTYGLRDGVGGTYGLRDSVGGTYGLRVGGCW